MSRFRIAVLAGLCLSIAGGPALAQIGYGQPGYAQEGYGQPGLGNSTFGIDNRLLGKLGGAAVGALIGSQIGQGNGNLLAIGAGGLLGFFAGGYLMDRLSPGSRNAIETAQFQALDAPVGQTIQWDSPDTANVSGSITPIRTGHNSIGQECREFRHVVLIDGRQETATGTACRGADGQWRLAAGDPG